MEPKVKLATNTLENLSDERGISPEEVIEQERENDGPLVDNFEKEQLDEALKLIRDEGG